jgi:predicted ATPase
MYVQILHRISATLTIILLALGIPYVRLLIEAETSKGDQMRLRGIEIIGIEPVRKFSIEGLTGIIVLAGPNGVGKTRILDAILRGFQRSTNNSTLRTTRLLIEATNDNERNTWRKPLLDTSVAGDAQKLIALLQSTPRIRSAWVSSVIQFESDRTIQKVQPVPFSFDMPDPWNETIGWETTFRGLTERWQDTQHSIFRKVKSQDDEYTRLMHARRSEGKQTMSLRGFTDPLQPFKKAFSQLLAPKQLIDPDPRNQVLQYSVDGKVLSIDTLSSGEREVVTIVFDFILRNASHSIVIFDEPELHLHPELSYKLVQTLRDVDESNQFIFATHSPDIITASLEHSVIFISPPKERNANQAILVRKEDKTRQALKLLGHSLGIVSLGKRIVLIEGEETSLDKHTYGDIVKSRFPELVLVPSGGRDFIQSFSSIVSDVLDQTLWGVEFFMLCDRDAVPPSVSADYLETKSGGRFRVLKRYHLENYFLNENVLAAVLAPMVRDGEWQGDASQVKAKLKEFARTMISLATARTVATKFRLNIGNLNIMPKGNSVGKSADELAQLMVERAANELGRINGTVDPTAIESEVRNTYAVLEQSLNDDTETWKVIIPGRPLLNALARDAGLNVGHLKTLYIAEADKHTPHPFADIIAIFEQFRSMSSYQAQPIEKPPTL